MSFSVNSNDYGKRFLHERETLEEALDFFATCAVPTGGHAPDSGYREVMCVGNPECALEATRLLKDAKFLD